MKNHEIKFGAYFCGNKISEYGRKYGRVDYRTLAESFDAVLNNSLMAELEAKGFYFDIDNGFEDHSDEIEELDEKIEALKDGFCEVYTSAGASYTDENGDEISEDKVDEIKAQIEELEEEKQELEENDPYNKEISQYFVISSAGAQILADYTNEIVFYCEKLDLYIWGVTHWGTSWDYVLTDIPCEIDENA